MFILGLFLLIGGYGFYQINKNIYPFYNYNKVYVSVKNPLIEKNVKIEFGISVNTISRTNDLDLFTNRDKYTVLYDGKNQKSIHNEYGENDFLITYDDKYYLSFRQYKLNRRHQHDYYFDFFQKNKKVFVSVNIKGEDKMIFEREMIKISDANKFVCNSPIESKGTIYNMIELVED